jgi:hypothetical protein
MCVVVAVSCCSARLDLSTEERGGPVWRCSAELQFLIYSSHPGRGGDRGCDRLEVDVKRARDREKTHSNQSAGRLACDFVDSVVRTVGASSAMDPERPHYSQTVSVFLSLYHIHLSRSHTHTHTHIHTYTHTHTLSLSLPHSLRSGGYISVMIVYSLAYYTSIKYYRVAFLVSEPDRSSRFRATIAV